MDSTVMIATTQTQVAKCSFIEEKVVTKEVNQAKAHLSNPGEEPL
jgi:hypothetical protein